MSAILYNITVTDGKGKVLVEETHTSPTMLVMELPKIRKRAEQKMQEDVELAKNWERMKLNEKCIQEADENRGLDLEGMGL